MQPLVDRIPGISGKSVIAVMGEDRRRCVRGMVEREARVFRFDGDRPSDGLGRLPRHHCDLHRRRPGGKARVQAAPRAAAKRQGGRR
jgi:hypothetical protein